MRRSLLTSVVATSVVCFAVLAIALGLGWSPKLGLDLEGGLSVIYTPAQHVSNDKLQTAATIMTDRANGLGVSGASVVTQGDQIDDEIPGIKNAQQALDQLGQTAQLYFRPVLCGAPAYTPPATPKGKAAKAVPYTQPPACPSQYTYSSGYWQNGTNGNGGLVLGQYAEYPPLASYTSTPQTVDAS